MSDCLTVILKVGTKAKLCLNCSESKRNITGVNKTLILTL